MSHDLDNPINQSNEYLNSSSQFEESKNRNVEDSPLLGQITENENDNSDLDQINHEEIVINNNINQQNVLKIVNKFIQTLRPAIKFNTILKHINNITDTDKQQIQIIFNKIS